MVVAHPCSHESPKRFPSGVGANSGDFLGSSAYKRVSLSGYLPMTGLFHKFLGANLAVKGVYPFSTVLEISWTISIFIYNR